MFIKLEGDTIINVDLVEKVEFNNNRSQATLWAGGIILFADSHLGFRYFSRAELIEEIPPPKGGAR